MPAAPQPAAMDLLFERFRKDYFLVPLGNFGLFCIPNFVARQVENNVQILLLTHVTKEDEEAIKTRLEGIPYHVSPDRLSLAEIEQQTGFHIPKS